MSEMKKRRLFAAMLCAAVMVFIGCDDVLKSGTAEVSIKTVEVTNEKEFLAAVNDSFVGTIIIKNDFVVNGAVNLKTKKNFIFIDGVTLEVDKIKVGTGIDINIILKDDKEDKKEEGDKNAGLLLSEGGEDDYTKVLLIDSGFYVGEGANFTLAEGYHLVFASAEVKAVVDGGLSVPSEKAIYHKGEGDSLNLTGKGKVKVGGVEEVIAEEGYSIMASSIEEKTPEEAGDDEGEKGSNTEAPVDETAISFASEDYTSGLAVDPENWSDDAWTLNVLEAGKVYFAVNKDASNTIEVGGVDAAKVTQAEDGTTIAEATEAGLTASGELAVFTVDTRDLVFEGGERNFTLGDVAVTLKMLPNLTGAAVFTVTWPESKDYYTSAYEDAVLTRVWGAGESEGALQAIEYVDRNATENTEYLVRVEKDELYLPRIFFVGNGQENVTLRLRGMGEPRTLAFNDGYYGSNNDSYNSSLITVKAPSNSGNRDNGFITIGYIGNNSPRNKTTFIIDNNITIKGGHESGNPDVYLHLIKLYYNATLVLRKGAVITEWTSDGTGAVIYVATNFIAGKTVYNNRVRIEGGSITNCTLGNDVYGHLLYFVGLQKEGESLWPVDSFYMAASTEDNPIVISGSTCDLFFSADKPKNYDIYILSEYTGTGLSRPAPVE
jgi:hypothetical protein